MIARLSGQVELQMAYWRNCVHRSNPEEYEWEDSTSRAEGPCKEFRASWQSSGKIVVPSLPVRPCSSVLSTLGISIVHRSLLSPLGQGVTSISCANEDELDKSRVLWKGISKYCRLSLRSPHRHGGTYSRILPILALS